METTLDAVLNRRVQLEQPKEGYRVAVDTVLLAAAVPAATGDHILDLGCGVGGAMLSLACRVAGLTGCGLDLQKDLVELCLRNIERNPFASGLKAETCDVTQLPALYDAQFDHVLANPPYHDEMTHDVSANAIKRLANSAGADDLGLWVKAAHRALKEGGTLTLIHRAEREKDLLDILCPYFSEIDYLFLLPKAGTIQKRVIMRARKGDGSAIRACRNLILHNDDGSYSQDADALLRHAQALSFQSP